MSNRVSPTTYRNRRIVALAVLAVVVVIIWNVVAGIVGFVSGVFHPASATPTPTATASATPGAVTACAPGSVVVQAVVGNGTAPQATFAAKEKPYLSYILTNMGSVDCTFNASVDVTFMKITSGSELIWNNGDCLSRKTASTPITILLKPGVPNPSTPDYWERVYSSSTGCNAKTEKPVIAGGASYKLTVTVNNVVSAPVQFILN
jgi:hypothetical protein